MFRRSAVVAVVSTMVFVLATALPSRAQPGELAGERILGLKNQIDTAVNEADRVALWKAWNALGKMAMRPESDRNRDTLKFIRYYAGYAGYRLGSLFEDMNKDQKEKYLDEAITYLEETTRLAPEFAEAWALLGSCYGMKATGLFSGMKYGPRSDRAIGRALELAPENPRAVMINGIGLMFKPAMFGGSVSKAVGEFRKAGGYFRDWISPGPLYPDWGEAENFAWMAQAHIRLEQLREARKAYGQALDVDPDYFWVKQVLLPELEVKLH